LKASDHRAKEFSAAELTSGLTRLANNADNSKEIMKHGILKHLQVMLTTGEQQLLTTGEQQLLANSSAVRFGTLPLRSRSRFPLPWLISQVHVNTYVEKLSCVHLYVCP